MVGGQLWIGSNPAGGMQIYPRISKRRDGILLPKQEIRKRLFVIAHSAIGYWLFAKRWLLAIMNCMAENGQTIPAGESIERG
jgi:hypothetical protein